jgi:hypothetical protein
MIECGAACCSRNIQKDIAQRTDPFGRKILRGFETEGHKRPDQQRSGRAHPVAEIVAQQRGVCEDTQGNEQQDIGDGFNPLSRVRWNGLLRPQQKSLARDEIIRDPKVDRGQRTARVFDLRTLDAFKIKQRDCASPVNVGLRIGSGGEVVFYFPAG